jgi:hypothetical protein
LGSGIGPLPGGDSLVGDDPRNDHFHAGCVDSGRKPMSILTGCVDAAGNQSLVKHTTFTL